MAGLFYFRNTIFEPMKKLLLALPVAFALACNNGGDQPPVNNDPVANTEPKLLSINIANQFPHDTSVFTEGFEFHNGSLYESAGNYGKSALVKYDLKTGKVDKRIPLDGKYFGEGITIINDKLYQLTYQEKDVLVYSLNDLKLINTLHWPREGWGMTNDSTNIYITDGSSNIYVVNPENFSVKNIIGVTDNNGPVNNLNELEYINGKLYCNRWQTPEILIIDPASGRVESKMDISAAIQILASNYNFNVQLEDSSPNGIAYNKQTKQLIITGKNWPASFEIKIN